MAKILEKNQKGQTTVEYILLLSVVIALVITFYNSAIFQQYFGPEGKMAVTIKRDSEFGYRHAYLIGRPDEPEPVQYNGLTHPSFMNNGSSRFFGPKDPYP